MYEPKLRGLVVQFYTRKYTQILTQILQELEEFYSEVSLKAQSYFMSFRYNSSPQQHRKTMITSFVLIRNLRQEQELS